MHKICGQSLCIITHCAKCRISGCRPAKILCIFSLDKCCRLCYTETTRARTVRAPPKTKGSDRKSPTLYYNMKSKSCQGFFNFICCTLDSSSILNVACHPCIICGLASGVQCVLACLLSLVRNHVADS